MPIKNISILSKYKSYELPYLLDGKTSIWDIISPLSEYLSFGNLMDTYWQVHDAGVSTIVGVQEFVRHYMPYFINISSSDFFLDLQDTLVLKHLSLHPIFNVNLLKSSDFYPIIDSYVCELWKVTQKFNDADKLEVLFPEYMMEITRFDIASIDMDGSMYAGISAPTTKIFYPEPFIASPSFVHEDLWFIHILHYQHWLWFMFISLIMFYFITFINVVRWCNLRNKPKRETRGVSRSKCADFITACVPVSWAISIIISESVDATDYYDGFGTGEILVGIRAYQWGWEYFYPRGIDLNYNVNPSYSTLVGNSLKYNNSSSKTLESNSFWKHYQNKKTNKLSTSPAHLILSPTDNSKVINFMDFDSAGLSTYKNSNAFKKIQYFSKVNPQLLYKSNEDYAVKYQKLNTLYLNDTSLYNSSEYNTLRQHGFSVNKSFTNNFATSLDNNSLSKLVNYNYGLNNNNTSSWENYKTNTHSRNSDLKPTSLSSNYSDLINNYSNNESYSSKNLINYPLKSTFVDSNTENKNSSNNFKFLLNSKLLKKNNVGSDSINDIASNNDFVISDTFKNYSNNLLNKDLTYRFIDLKPSSSTLLTSERTPRLLNNLNPSKLNSNYSSSDNSLNALVSESLSSQTTLNQETLFNTSDSNWVIDNSFTRLLSSNLTTPVSEIPLNSNTTNSNSKSFDKFDSANEDLTPSMLQSKEESAPNYLFSNYWLTYWLNTNPTNSISSNLKNVDLDKTFYLPTITKYAEYDFRNWQALELLEDAFWESSFSSYTQDDYFNTLQDMNEYLLFKKQEEAFDTKTRFNGSVLSKKNKTLHKSLSKPFFKNSIHSNNLSSLPIFSEDHFVDSQLMKLNNFKFYTDEISIDSMDEVYDSIKNSNTLLNSNYTNILESGMVSVQPVSYTKILDYFRADYEDSSNSTDFEDNKTLNESPLSLDENSRAFNPVKLRSTARNSIVTFNAIQKVFKSRYDEGRSNARLQDLSNSYNSHLFLTASKTPYERILGKNYESFFNVNLYNTTLSTNFSDFFSVWNSLNTYYIDLPFLVSNTSDSSRHLWFDWQSRWSSIEIQPSSVARYSLSGVPYFNKSSEYSTQFGDELNDSENYFNRLLRARKNYVSNWSYTPYFYNRSMKWNNPNLVSNLLYDSNSITNLKMTLRYSSQFWSNLNISTTSTLNYNHSFSSFNTPGRAFSKPSTLFSSYIYTSNTLVDILSKREYIYRQLFSSKNLIANLPDYLTSSPKNPLINEVLASYPLVDPINFSSELSRDYLYQNYNFLRFTLLKDFLIFVNEGIKNSSLNLNFLNNYLFFYMFSDTKSDTLGKNLDLYKNQYRPMKKGVANMVRLHSTGAIALPIEVRLHILASSKDVIHSWAIPSAGIKIDCVPGYTSHRTMIFLCSGIFWGQCMEICGRFHHWMPIVVYFMKRDLFFLWCTHFMHYSSLDNFFDMTDKQLSDCVKLTSFDTTSWVNEFNKLV